ncbi:MAG: hypothetical protein H5T69_20750 [Chloroflexi bacterium]|nr:hypothetical protein [Chloroflexota bacterium]
MWNKLMQARERVESYPWPTWSREVLGVIGALFLLAIAAIINTWLG